MFAVLTGQWNYNIEVVVNASNAEIFELIQSSLNATSFPIKVDNNTEITDISTTTGEQQLWPYLKNIQKKQHITKVHGLKLSSFWQCVP